MSQPPRYSSRHPPSRDDASYGYNSRYAAPSTGSRTHGRARDEGRSVSRPSVSQQEHHYRPSHAKHHVSRNAPEQQSSRHRDRERDRDRGLRPRSISPAHGDRARSRQPQYPQSSRRPKNSDSRKSARGSEILLGAGRCAFKAGAKAAHSAGDDPGPWVGPKGAKVVAVALGAAAVDTFMEQRHPGSSKDGLRCKVMRRATQTAIGALVTTPAANYSSRNMPRAKESLGEMMHEYGYGHGHGRRRR